MLSRIGNSLFWLGRYIERAEHTARYTRVQYVSSLDSPMMYKKQFVLESILDMVGYQFNHIINDNDLSESDVFRLVCLDEFNLFSVKSSIGAARENARGARDIISSELWEIINKYYHTVNNFLEEDFKKDGPFDFSDMVVEQSSIVKGCIDNTHIHNHHWELISLGLHIERSIQIIRICIAKMHDISKANNSSEVSYLNYHVSTLLKSAESFDMCRKYFGNIPNWSNALDFLLANKDFPKSITFNLLKANKLLLSLDLGEHTPDSPDFILGKLATQFQYLTYDEMNNNTLVFLNSSLVSLYRIASSIEQKYLSY